MSLHSVRLPDHLAREIEELAAAQRTTRSHLVREALERYCASARAGTAGSDRVTLLRRLVTYPGSGRADLGEQSERYLRKLFGERRRGSR